MSLLIFGLFVLQSALVALRESAPAVAALHPVNGFLILLISISMAQRAWRELRNPGGADAPEPLAV
jgi:hypothetical protein